MADNDPLHELVDELIRLRPDMRATLVALEAACRKRWGGERVYFAKEPSRLKALDLAAAIATTSAWGEAVGQAGLSRAHSFRLRSRWIAR